MASSKLSDLANAHAKQVLGPEQYARNRDAVKGITSDFKAGYKAGLKDGQAGPAASTKPLRPGEQVRIVGQHPWQGTTGELVSFGPYGLAALELEGWLVSLSGNNGQCYAKAHEVARLPAIK